MSKTELLESIRKHLPHLVRIPPASRKILQILKNRRTGIYGFEILRAVETKHNKRMKPATFYSSINNLIQKGLVLSKEREVEIVYRATGGKQTQKQFSITKLGRFVLRNI